MTEAVLEPYLLVTIVRGREEDGGDDDAAAVVVVEFDVEVVVEMQAGDDGDFAVGAMAEAAAAF